MINKFSSETNSLIEAAKVTEDIAREIYYAISLLPKNHPAEANLKLALNYLGIKSPKEVGLSSNILRYREIN